jgi:hypothetical protein
MDLTTNRLYINNYTYRIPYENNPGATFSFALIAATIIAVIVAPFVVR